MTLTAEQEVSEPWRAIGSGSWTVGERREGGKTILGCGANAISECKQCKPNWTRLARGAGTLDPNGDSPPLSFDREITTPTLRGFSNIFTWGSLLSSRPPYSHNGRRYQCCFGSAAHRFPPQPCRFRQHYLPDRAEAVEAWFPVQCHVCRYA